VSWKKIKNKNALDEDSGVNSVPVPTQKQSLANIGNGKLGKLWLYRIVEGYPVTKPPQSTKQVLVQKTCDLCTVVEDSCRGSRLKSGGYIDGFSDFALGGDKNLGGDPPENVESFGLI
jgi:hypothetical protein